MKAKDHIKVSKDMFVKKGAVAINQIYEIGQELGKGAYGEVHTCVHKETKETHAVKILFKEKMDEDEQATMQAEIDILRGLDHPNIVKIYEYFEDETRFYIVQDYIDGGQLLDEILSRGKFDEKDAAVLMKTLLQSISYCHHHNIVHRDLKPENILLEASKEFDQIKVIDFGAAKVFKIGEHLKQLVGTVYYIAPEVLNHDYGKACDIWSLGVMAYMFLSGIPPFNGGNDSEIFEAIKKGKFSFDTMVWNGVSQHAKDFISAMLTYDQTKRPSAKQMLQHTWITEHSALQIDETSASHALQNLTHFHSHATLKKAALNFIGSQLISKEEREELGRVFKLLDKNGDGKLSREEIKEGYQHLHGGLIQSKKVDDMFDAVDTDESGYIEYTEFVVAAENEKALLTNERLIAAFKMFDKDGSGTITFAEIKKVLMAGNSKIPNAVINTIMKLGDKDENDSISLDEFTHLMRNAAA